MDVKVWWYFARAGGLTAWFLLSASVLWGLLLSTRAMRGRVPAYRVLDLHRFLGGSTFMFLLVHTGVLIGSKMHFGFAELLLPFRSPYRPGAVAWGVVAAYLMFAVQLTSWLRPHIPRRLWRAVHFATFPLFVCATVHMLKAGTDTGHPVIRGAVVTVCALIGLLLVYRLLDAVRRAMPSGTAVRVLSAEPAADGVMALHLGRPRGGTLPAWQAGAHLEIVLPSGRVRHYSLCGDPDDRSTYRIGVLRVPEGRGGSAEVHQLRPGRRLRIRGPRDQFPLEPAERYLFIAGGIGITPMLSLAREAEARGAEWEFLYLGRSLSTMAFADEVRALAGDRARLVPADTDGRVDLPDVLGKQPDGTAVYSCGPTPLLDALAELVPDFPGLSLHVERFSAAPLSGEREFEVELTRTGTVLTVPSDRSVLDVVRGVTQVDSSCETGICGTCEVRVLAGAVDHRDGVLTEAQKACGDRMYPCVSRALGDRLKLDL